MNIELLKAIREKIATTPEAYDQEVYGRPEPSAPCGTAACIAGWACVLSDAIPITEVQASNQRDRRGRINQELAQRIKTAARVALRLTIDEAEMLFTGEPEGEWFDYDDEGNDIYEDGWPEPFRTQWRNAGYQERPQIAMAYLDYIISTGKVLA